MNVKQKINVGKPFQLKTGQPGSVAIVWFPSQSDFTMNERKNMWKIQREKQYSFSFFCYSIVSIHWSLFEASSIISSCYYSFIKVPRVRITLHKALNCKIYINFTWTKIWNLKLQTCCRFLEKTGSRYGICKASVYSALIERRSPRKPHNTDCRVDIVASGSNWSIHCIKAD